MTHNWAKENQISLGWLDISFTGTPAVGDYFTLALGALNDVGAVLVNSTTVSLPAGRYHIRGEVGGNRGALSDYLGYQWEIGGTLEGNIGGWDSSSSRQMTAEYAEYVFTLAATTNIKLRCDSVQGTLTIDSDYCGAFIKGTD